MRELYECVERVSTIADFGGTDGGPTLAWAQVQMAPVAPAILVTISARGPGGPATVLPSNRCFQAFRRLRRPCRGGATLALFPVFLFKHLPEVFVLPPCRLKIKKLILDAHT